MTLPAFSAMNVAVQYVVIQCILCVCVCVRARARTQPAFTWLVANLTALLYKTSVVVVGLPIRARVLA